MSDNLHTLHNIREQLRAASRRAPCWLETADFVCLLPTAVLDCRANVDQLSSSRS